MHRVEEGAGGQHDGGGFDLEDLAADVVLAPVTRRRRVASRLVSRLVSRVVQAGCRAGHGVAGRCARGGHALDAGDGVPLLATVDEAHHLDVVGEGSTLDGRRERDGLWG